MRDEQWNAVTPPASPRIRDGLTVLKDGLSDFPPYRAWTCFQFLPLEGGFLEVDALIVSSAGVFLVGLETFGGQLECRDGTWRHTRQNDETGLHDNPLRELHYAANELRTMLDHYLPSSVRAPRIEPLVFLTEPDVEVRGDERQTERVAFHPDHSREPSILDAISEGTGRGIHPVETELDDRVGKRIEAAFDEAGMVQTDRSFRVGRWKLGELLDAAPRYKEYVATHTADDRDDRARARVFWAPRGAADETLERLQEAARREASLLEELTHPSILELRDYIGHETRPTILFEDPEGARRLDRVAEAGELPSPQRRLELLSEVADAVRYAHNQKIVHRALTPHSVLLTDDDPGVRVFNWHTGRKPAHETGTRHVSDYLESSAQFFLAPELLNGPNVDESADIFGLGALAYYLFAEQPPAESIPEFISRLEGDGGLRLSSDASVDVSPDLDELVYRATRANPEERLSSVEAFLDALDDYWDDHGTPADRADDPLSAEPGDRIGGRWKVERRLGTGSTATAISATNREGRRVVLKIANDDGQSRYLEAEAEALSTIDCDYVVDLYERTTLAGRTTLVLQHAGQTLRRVLRDRAALSIDEQRRFGAHLCQIVTDLRRAKIHHRDIKPSNLGVGQVETNRGPTSLLLFDFSLHDIGIERTHAGTDAYRDPFLAERGEWDFAADQYSAALVLYEMVTQRLPSWGEEGANPAVVQDVRLDLDEERFPAPVRDELADFFRTALSRDVSDRFGSGEEMLRAWREIYETTLHSRHESADLESASPDTAMAELGVSSAAREQLATLGIETVSEFLDTSTQQFYFQEGSGPAVREELVELHDQLGELFPHLVGDEEREAPQRSRESFESYSIDQIREVLREKPDEFPVDLELADGGFARLVDVVLGFGNRDGALPWRRWSAVHDRVQRELGLGVEQAEAAVEELRAGWSRKRVLPSVREDLVELVENESGVASDIGIAHGLLGMRGALIEGRKDRLAAAAAVGRAAFEAERTSDDTRLEIRRLGDANGAGDARVFVATRPELLDVLEPLGRRADELARATSVPSPKRAARSLSELMLSAGFDPWPRRRLLQVAARASREAALSSREELYPVGMDALRALRLSTNLLRRRAPLSPDELRESVRNRYPDAAPLPEHPELEKYVERADIGLEWAPEAREGRGAYRSEYRSDRSSPALSASVETESWHSTMPGETPAGDASEVRSTLRSKSDDKGLFVLIAKERHLRRSAEVLAATFDLEVVSVERLLVEELRRAADEEGVPWETVLEADAMDWSERDEVRRQLERRVFHTGEDEASVAWRVRERLLEIDSDRVLLVDNGLLGRWDEFLRWAPTGDRMQLVHALHDRTRSEGPSVVWMLVAAEPDSKMPKLGPRPVPVDESDYFHLRSSHVEVLR